MNILFLSRWFPYPPDNGSKLRIYNLLRGLSTEHSVSLLSFTDSTRDDHIPLPLQTLCQDVQTVLWKPYKSDGKRARLGFFSLKPRSIIGTFSPELKGKIDQMLAAHEFDLIIASQIDMAAYIEHFQGKPAIFEEIEATVLHERYAKASSPATRIRHLLTWIKYRRYLSTLVKNYQACTVVSERERQLVTKTAGYSSHIEVIPNGVELADYSEVNETPSPNTLIFTGSFTYYPNYEAMLWFTNNVFPIIRQQIPNVTLTITGNHTGRTLSQNKNVDLTGFVDDVRPLIARAWASVVPIHTGGGTRLKILEAMALKTPVIATSKGAEGIGAEHGRHILIADTPDDYAQMVIRLLKKPQLRKRLVNDGYKLVCENYNWPVIMPRFHNLIQKIALSKDTLQDTKKS